MLVDGQAALFEAKPKKKTVSAIESGVKCSEEGTFGSPFGSVFSFGGKPIRKLLRNKRMQKPNAKRRRGPNVGWAGATPSVRHSAAETPCGVAPALSRVSREPFWPRYENRT